MTLQELRSRVADALAQPIDADGALTEARVDRAINDGYVRFAMDTRCFTREVTLAAVSDQGRYALPVDVVEVLKVWVDGCPLAATTAELLDRDDPAWRERTAGTPEQFVREGALGLRLTPAPASAGTIRVLAEVTPSAEVEGVPALTAAEDAPQLPLPYHDAPALWAVAILAAFLFNDDPKAQAAAQAALAHYARLVKEYTAAQVVKAAYA